MIQDSINPFISFNKIISDYIDENFDYTKTYNVRKYHKFEKRKNSNLISGFKNIIDPLFEKNIDINKWVLNIYHFIIYLRYAEKCYFFNNSEGNVLYSEILENSEGTTYNLYYNHFKGYIGIDKPYTDYKVRISLNFSKIPKIDTNNLLETYMSTNEDAFTIFCNVDIRREYGKQMKNTFNWIYGKELNIDGDSDKESIYVVASKINKEIYNLYDNLLSINLRAHNINFVRKDSLYSSDYSNYIDWEDLENCKITEEH